MAEITEKIDLTLNSYFAGDSNPFLKPAKWRMGNVEHFLKRHIALTFPNFESSNFLRKPEPDPVSSYYRMFGEMPDSIYAEILGYGDPNYCQICGIPTNLLTKNEPYDACEKCYQRDAQKTIQLQEGGRDKSRTMPLL